LGEGVSDVDAASSQISAELERVHEESYGVGSRGMETYILDSVVLVIIDIKITEAERTLIEAGRVDAVVDMRRHFQQAIAPTFKAIVERATGRRVAAFVSEMHTDPLFSAELFRLGPDLAHPQEPA
jgi:uncharacterized protein YbcI